MFIAAGSSEEPEDLYLALQNLFVEAAGSSKGSLDLRLWPDRRADLLSDLSGPRPEVSLCSVEPDALSRTGPLLQPPDPEEGMITRASSFVGEGPASGTGAGGDLLIFDFGLDLSSFTVADRTRAGLGTWGEASPRLLCSGLAGAISLSVRENSGWATLI